MCGYECDFLLNHFIETNIKLRLEYTREYDMANPSKVPGPRVSELLSLAMTFCLAVSCIMTLD
jgi:hypothetical protein